MFLFIYDSSLYSSMRYILVLLILFSISILSILSIQISAAPELFGKLHDLRVEGIYQPLEKNTMTVSISARLEVIEPLNLNSNKSALGFKIKIFADTQTFTILTDKDGKFMVEFETMLRDPGIYPNFATLKSSEITLPDTKYDLIVLKDNLVSSFDDMVAEYNDSITVSGTMNKYNDFVQSLKAKIIYNSSLMGVASFFDDTSGNELLSKNSLSFAAKINNTFSLGRHTLRFYIPENKYYRKLNTTFTINIGKALANLAVLESNQYEIEYRDTLTVFAIDKYNQTLSNVKVTLQIGTNIQHQLTSKDGVALFALYEIVAKDQAEGMNFTLAAHADIYYFINVTFVIHTPRSNENIFSQLQSLVGNFGNHGLLKAIGIVTGVQILSNRLQRRKNKINQDNNKLGFHPNRTNNWRLNTNR